MVAKVDKKSMACNKPRATPDHPKKSHIVKACSEGQEKVIRFGQKGVKGSPEGSARNDAFKARHAKNIAKGKMSAGWWASKVKWTITAIMLNGVLMIDYVANTGF